jgi:hypothetical protein
MSRTDAFVRVAANNCWKWIRLKSRNQSECVLSRELGVFFEQKVRSFEGAAHSLTHAFLVLAFHFSIIFLRLMLSSWPLQLHHHCLGAGSHHLLGKGGSSVVEPLACAHCQPASRVMQWGSALLHTHSPTHSIMHIIVSVAIVDG